MKPVVSIALCLAFLSSGADAAIVVDQSALAKVDPDFILTASGVSLYWDPGLARLAQMQSVTANKAGILQGVDLQLVAGKSYPDLPFQVSLVNGAPGVSGTIETVGSVNFIKSMVPTGDEANSGLLFYVDFSEFKYQLEVGQQFSIMISIINSGVPVNSSPISGPSWVYGTATPDYENENWIEYPYGYNVIFFGDGTQVVSGADRGFRTYVDTGSVPEPTTWAMLIVGFGLVGRAMRRNQARVFT